MAQKQMMTEAGRERAKQRLIALKEQSNRAFERMKNARGNSDIPINSDFTLAKDELIYVEQQIKELENLLDNAEIIPDGAANDDPTVDVGKKVTFRELPDGEDETYTILGKTEADPAQGIISYESPMAKSLLGKTVGDIVDVVLPEETIQVEITAVESV